MTPIQLHVQGWKDCQRCELHKCRQKVVFGRGSIPADILFCGMAPGESEDCIGVPFVGPAGGLFDSILRDGLPGTYSTAEDGVTSVWKSSIPFAVSNLVCCIPRLPDEDNRLSRRGEVADPDAHHIEACGPRLQEFVNIVNPKLVVAVGALARDWFPHVVKLKPEVKFVDITHPSWILKQNVMQQGLAAQRCAVIIASAVEDMQNASS